MAAGGIITIVFDLKLAQKAWRKLSPRKTPPPQQDGQHSSIEMGSVGQSTEGQSSTTNLHARISTLKQTVDPSAAITEDQSVAEEIAHQHTNPAGNWKVGSMIIAAFLASFITVMVLRGIYSSENRGFGKSFCFRARSVLNNHPLNYARTVHRPPPSMTDSLQRQTSSPTST
jgi:hypothetical protein